MGIEKGLTEHEKEIMFNDFPDSHKEIEFDRETIERYSKNSRDVRISTGRYYTKKEMEERAKAAFSVKLY